MDTLRITRPRVGGFGGERLRTLVIMVVAAVAILGAAALLDRSGAAGFTTVSLTGDTSGPRPVVGGTPPQFNATTVTGEAFSLAALQGRPVWLTFGASWCADCRAEAPDVEAAYERYAPAGLALVSVWISEADQDVRDYASRAGLTFTMISDASTSLASRYQILGLPTHYFITPDGVIREIRLGGLPPDAMDRLVGSIMP
jgi:peroxiredoxin